MKKNLISNKKKTTLFVALVLFLMFIGIVLNRAYQITPENHLVIASEMVKKNPIKAVRHFKYAANSKNESTRLLSYLHLARLYHHGQDNFEANIPKAVYYYEQAALHNSNEAYYKLALFYDAGDKVPENREKAIDYMKKAAATLPEAKYALGVWMERGYMGKPNMDKVVQLYEEAAKAGVINAIKSLIAIYQNGYGGFPRNIEWEYYWRDQLKKKAIK